MEKKNIVAIVLMVASLPLIFFGLIDALEGGISMLFAGAILTVAHLVLRQKPAKYLWIPYLLAIVLAVVTLAIAIVGLEFTSSPRPLPFPVIIGNWLYRGAVLATLIGAAISLVNVFRSPTAKH